MKLGLRFLMLLALLLSSLNARAVNDADEREASTKASAVADKMLNDIYTKVLGLFEADEQVALRAAQKAWVALRDAEADRISLSAKNSNIYKMVRDDALRTATIKRFSELLNMYFDNYALVLDRQKVKQE